MLFKNDYKTFFIQPFAPVSFTLDSMQAQIKKRVATSEICDSDAKRPCVEEIIQDYSSDKLDVFEHDSTDASKEQDIQFEHDDLDLLPVEVMHRIVKHIIPPDGFDDSDFVSLCRVSKRRRQMWNNSDLCPTLRITSATSPLQKGVAYPNFRKLFLSSSQEERRLHVTMPISFTNIIVITACLSNLTHLSINLHRPPYKKIIPFLPPRLESLHLSSWSSFGDACADPDNLYHAGAHNCHFDHLVNLKRLSLFADESIDSLSLAQCNTFKFPSTLETLHMPFTAMDLTRATSLQRGWENITTLGIGAIAAKKLDFLPLLKALVCYGKCDISTNEGAHTLITSVKREWQARRLVAATISTLAVHIVIPKNDDFDAMSIALALQGCDSSKYRLYRDTLIPINVCKPLCLPWLPRVSE